MLPEIETLDAALSAAGNTFEAADKANETEYDDDKIDYTTYRDRRRVLKATQSATDEAAWTAFKEVATDPLILWMLENTIEGYPDDSLDVLKQLPATADQLYDYGATKWCGIFRDLYSRAETAGVLPGLDMSASAVARRELHRYLRSVTYTSDLNRVRIAELVQGIVAAATATEDDAPQD